MPTFFLLIDNAGNKLKIDNEHFLIIEDFPSNTDNLISGDVEFLKSVSGDVEFTKHVADGIIADPTS